MLSVIALPELPLPHTKKVHEYCDNPKSQSVHKVTKK